MADLTLAAKLIVDAETGQIKAVQQELEGMTTTLGTKIPQAAEKSGSAFAGVGSIVKAIGIARVLEGAAVQALQSSQAFTDLRDQLAVTADTIVGDLEPALTFVSRGLQGLLVFVSKAGEAFMGLLDILASWKTLFTEGLDAAAKQVQAASDRVGQAVVDGIAGGLDRVLGATKITTDKQLEILLESTRLRVANANMEASEKLRILDAAEKEAMQLLERTTKFRTSREEEQELERLKLQNRFADLRRRAAVRENGDAESLLERRLEAEIEVLGQQAASRLALEADTLDQKLAIITEREEAQLATIQSYRDQGLLDEQSAQERVVAVVAKGAADRAAVELQDATKRLSDRRKLFGDLISAGADAAAREFEDTKNVGRALQAAGAEQIRTLANQAASKIAIAGAEAAARSFANAGGWPLGVPAAIATVAYYTTLAATVSAAGAVAANFVAPSGGGGGSGGGSATGGGGSAASAGGGTTAADRAASEAREQEKRNEAATVDWESDRRIKESIQRQRVEFARQQGRATTLAENQAAAQAHAIRLKELREAQRPITVVNISTLDGRVPQETIDAILAGIERRAAS